MRATFVRAEPAADHITTFYFQPESKLHQVAGQFTELRIPHDNTDNRGDRRWFTLSNSPTEQLLTITSKFAKGRSSSFKTALQALQPGAELDLAAPMGDFVLPKDASIPLTFVAGGIGVTPYHSMVKFCQDRGEQRDITLLYAANTPGEIAFRDTFEQLGDAFHTLIGSTLHAANVAEIANKDGYIYLSGPEPMIEDLHKELCDAGFSKSQLHTDFFPNYDII